MECKTLKNPEAQGAPKHLTVIITPSAHMTDEAWATTPVSLAKGIRSLPVVCDHPEWWFMLLLAVRLSREGQRQKALQSVALCATYWHYLLLVWFVLFALLLRT